LITISSFSHIKDFSTQLESSIGKLCDLLEHFDEKGTVDFNEYQFFTEQFVIVVLAYDNCVTFAQTV